MLLISALNTKSSGFVEICCWLWSAPVLDMIFPAGNWTERGGAKPPPRAGCRAGGRGGRVSRMTRAFRVINGGGGWLRVMPPPVAPFGRPLWPARRGGSCPCLHCGATTMRCAGSAFLKLLRLGLWIFVPLLVKRRRSAQLHPHDGRNLLRVMHREPFSLWQSFDPGRARLVRLPSIPMGAPSRALPKHRRETQPCPT